MPSYTTVAGETIKSVKIGWEAGGTLNADKSNAILITHYFSGTSHAFGKYAASDKAAGYWDAIIGPGKAIDTNKYYVLSADTLVKSQHQDAERGDRRTRDRLAARCRSTLSRVHRTQQCPLCHDPASATDDPSKPKKR